MEELTRVQIVGMVWYRQEDYDACMAIMADRARINQPYHLWRMQAETGEKKQRRAGFTVIRAYIDPKTFPDWCRENGLSVDAKARGQFAAKVAMEIATGGNLDQGIH